MESLATGTTDSVTTIYHGGAASDVVVAAVAKAKGVDPLDLDPLYDVVDPDALDRLFADGKAGSASLEVSFTMADCEVVVDGSGEVAVTLSESETCSVTASLDG